MKYRVTVAIGLMVSLLYLAGPMRSQGAEQAGGAGQTTVPQTNAGPSNVAPEVAAVPQATKLTEKQKALAQQTEQLVAMASELKVQVDKTNKNILSMTVVQKAEEIEQFAHRMKEQAKK